MMKLRGLLLLLLFGAAVQAQDSAVPAEVPETQADAAAGSEDVAEDVAEKELDPLADADLDEQTYEEDEDVFVPSEEIPSDEPIPFPTNI